jgi:hypothetical protein
MNTDEAFAQYAAHRAAELAKYEKPKAEPVATPAPAPAPVMDHNAIANAVAAGMHRKEWDDRVGGVGTVAGLAIAFGVPIIGVPLLGVAAGLNAMRNRI